MYNSINEFNDNFNLRGYVSDLYGVENDESREFLKINCPFHPESTASCTIYENTYHCYGAGCGAHGNTFDFVSKTTGLQVKEILELDFRRSHQDNTKSKRIRKKGYISKTLIHKFNKELLAKPKKMQYLMDRGFDKRSIEESGIGYAQNVQGIFTNFNAPRYVIPVYDENKRLSTARYRIDPEFTQPEPKYLAHPNTDACLYNSHIIHGNNNIVIVGSELDAAFLYYRYGIFAIAPPGEGNFKASWLSFFCKQHNVLIWLDNDYAGMQGSIKMYNMLKLICTAQIYNWNPGFGLKYDVCDYVKEYTILAIYEELNKYGVKAYD